MRFYKRKPNKLGEPTDLLNEMKKNPLALELLNEVNKKRKNAGQPEVTFTLFRRLDCGAICYQETGEIHISSKLPKNEQLIVLIFELCNIAVDRSHLDLVNKRYPMRREVYIKEIEKSEKLAGLKMLKIYGYGVKNLGWDSETFKEYQYFKIPFNTYYNHLKTYSKEHTEFYGKKWDEVKKWEEEKEHSKIQYRK